MRLPPEEQECFVDLEWAQSRIGKSELYQRRQFSGRHYFSSSLLFQLFEKWLQLLRRKVAGARNELHVANALQRRRIVEQKRLRLQRLAAVLALGPQHVGHSLEQP